MRILLFGELGPGALARSLQPGLSEEATVFGTDPYWVSGGLTTGTSGILRHAGRLESRLRLRHVGQALREAVSDLEPDVVLIVKGRGLQPPSIEQVRSVGVPVALYYPDNPRWSFSDTRGAQDRLVRCDLAVVWSERLAQRLRDLGARARALPFGYDQRWWGPHPPGGDREGIVFLGQWSRRRERYLSALTGLPLTVRGKGWEASGVPSGPPVFGPEAGALLARAAIGVNVLHPANAGAHNMRTREICAAGAMQLTNPGTDGTPLRPPEGCAWFESPEELRRLALHYLANPAEAVEAARTAQALTIDDTYLERGRTLGRWLHELAGAR